MLLKRNCKTIKNDDIIHNHVESFINNVHNSNKYIDNIDNIDNIIDYRNFKNEKIDEFHKNSENKKSINQNISNFDKNKDKSLNKNNMSVNENNKNVDIKLTFNKGRAFKTKFCNTCFIFRPPGTSHCSKCNRCIERYDHHCPWIGNCIGINNYFLFFGFINSLVFKLVYNFIITLYFIIVKKSKENVKNSNYLKIHDSSLFIFIALIFAQACVVAMIWAYNLLFICMNLTTYCYNKLNDVILIYSNPFAKKSIFENIVFSLIKNRENRGIRFSLNKKENIKKIDIDNSEINLLNYEKNNLESLFKIKDKEIEDYYKSEISKSINSKSISVKNKNNSKLHNKNDDIIDINNNILSLNQNEDYIQENIKNNLNKNKILNSKQINHDNNQSVKGIMNKSFKSMKEMNEKRFLDFGSDLYIDNVLNSSYNEENSDKLYPIHKILTNINEDFTSYDKLNKFINKK